METNTSGFNTCFWDSAPTLYSLEKLIEWKLDRVVKIRGQYLLSLLAREIN
ncbi:hypothetical protein MAESPC_02239 [Microcystis aeruginosa SPC777]|uniref:Uncharacterized protein n=1 Tax=Microcystis aeruginosa SPC777 TaxID=482300 RepID=S3JBL2_MICAE|nr:hypothetical protein MAESPC_02239 [Microcystis aeruginosa SPC777]